MGKGFQKGMAMLCFRESNKTHCAYLPTEEFHLEYFQDFLMGLQVVTVFLMLALLEKLWRDWRPCLKKPVQTGWTLSGLCWTIMIHKFILVCNFVLCHVSLSICTSWIFSSLISLTIFCLPAAVIFSGANLVFDYIWQTCSSSIQPNFYRLNILFKGTCDNFELTYGCNNFIHLL